MSPADKIICRVTAQSRLLVAADRIRLGIQEWEALRDNKDPATPPDLIRGRYSITLCGVPVELTEDRSTLEVVVKVP